MNRVWIELDRDALTNNISQYKAMLPSETDVMCVVKANAYGHGAQAISQHLQDIGVRFFATASLEEAIQLRLWGIRGEILILGYTDPSLFSHLIEFDLIQTLTCEEYASELETYGIRFGQRPKAHIAVDTGMHRIGFIYKDIDILQRFYQSEGIHVCGIFSHLCVADSKEETNVIFSEQQCERFDMAISELKMRGVALGTVHLLSSYAAINYNAKTYDYARLGILMFGTRSSPCSDDYLSRNIQLQPVMTLKSRITSIRKIEEGDSVSYGRIFRANKPTVVASVAVGYSDGLPRCLSGGKIRAIVGGKYAAGIGRICMDQLMLDVTDIENLHVGDEVIFIGRSGDCAIYAEEIARNAGTITNEFFSRLSSRVEGRCFKDQNG